MAVFTKTDDIVILAHQNLTHPGSIVGSSIDVSDDLACKIVIYLAYIESTLTNVGADYHVQISPSSGTDNDDWGTLVRIRTIAEQVGLATLTGTEAIGSKNLNVSSSAGYIAGQTLYIQDTGTLADSEWALCDGLDGSGTSIDIVDGLTRAKDSADKVIDNAARFVVVLNLISIKRLRIVFVHRASGGPDVHTKVIMVRGDSIG